MPWVIKYNRVSIYKRNETHMQLTHLMTHTQCHWQIHVLPWHYQPSNTRLLKLNHYTNVEQPSVTIAIKIPTMNDVTQLFSLFIPPTLNSLAPGSENQGAEKTDLWPVAHGLKNSNLTPIAMTIKRQKVLHWSVKRNKNDSCANHFQRPKITLLGNPRSQKHHPPCRAHPVGAFPKIPPHRRAMREWKSSHLVLALSPATSLSDDRDTTIGQ